MSDPQRDRDLARRPRYRARTATNVGDVVAGLIAGEAAARQRRFARVAQALNRALDPTTRAKLKPIALSAGTLTIEVADGTLLAELRQHRAHALQAAMVEAGAGVDRIVWRVARSVRPRHLR